jgi:hypothetical protein
MFLIKEILNCKTYINNFFVGTKLVKNFNDYLFINKNKEFFKDEFLNKYIKLNTKIWKKKIISKKSKKKILVESLINHPHYLIPSCLIGMELSEFHNLECVGMIRKGDLISEKIMRSFGINEIIKIDEGNFFIRLFYFLKSIKILGFKKSSLSLINFKINKIEIGKNVYESYVRYKNMPVPKILNYPFYYLLSKILYINNLIKKILIKKKYVCLVQAENQFIPFRVLFQNALKQKIQIYTRQGLRNIKIRKFDNFMDRNTNTLKIDKKLVNFYYNNYKDKILLNWGNDIKKSVKKNMGSEIYQMLNISNVPTKTFKNKKEICKLFNWNVNDPIVLILSHDLIDGNFLNKWNLFIDNRDWLTETLKKINKIDNINWIIKPHPSETLSMSEINTKDVFNEIIKSNKNNIKLYPENYSIKNFYKHIKVVITSHGTAGYQYPAFGKPVIVCGDTYYGGHNFNLEPKSKNEYYKILANIKKIRSLKKSQIEKNIVFCYVFDTITKLKIPTIPHTDITMNYDRKKFWKKSYQLLLKNQKKETNFSKSFNFQLLKNNTNLINLEKKYL